MVTEYQRVGLGQVRAKVKCLALDPMRAGPARQSFGPTLALIGSGGPTGPGPAYGQCSYDNYLNHDIAFGVLDLVENSISQCCIIVIGITGHTHLVRGRHRVINVSW